MSWLTASGNTVFPITAMSCFIDGWISTEASMRHSTTYYYWNQCPCPQRFMIARCTALWCKWNVLWCRMMLLRFELFLKTGWKIAWRIPSRRYLHNYFYIAFLNLATFNENTFFQQHCREMSLRELKDVLFQWRWTFQRWILVMTCVTDVGGGAMTALFSTLTNSFRPARHRRAPLRQSTSLYQWKCHLSVYKDHFCSQKNNGSHYNHTVNVFTLSRL